MAVEMISDKTYEKFLRSTPAVCMVGESWCPHCQRYSPVIDSLADRLPKVRFGRIFLDKDPSERLIERFALVISIRGRIDLPTTMIFRNPRDLVFFGGEYGLEDAYEIVSGVLNSDQDSPDIYIARLHHIDLGNEKPTPTSLLARNFRRLFMR